MLDDDWAGGFVTSRIALRTNLGFCCVVPRAETTTRRLRRRLDPPSIVVHCPDFSLKLAEERNEL